MTRKARFRNLGAGKGIKQELSSEVLRKLYLVDGLTQSAIARRFGCSPQFVSLLIAEYGLKRAGPLPRSEGSEQSSG